MSLKYEPASEPLHISVVLEVLRDDQQVAGGGSVLGAQVQGCDFVLGGLVLESKPQTLIPKRIQGLGCRV